MSATGPKSPVDQGLAERRTGRQRRGDGEPSEVSAFDDAAWVGRVIDERYRIESLLGEGGMGAVFLAEHLKLQKKVALKVILPQFAGDGEIAERFAREAMASAKLEHPHIASALDFGTLPEGGAYLVMQFVKGRSLREAAPEHVGDWRFAATVGAQIADALAAAHTSGFVHRDLKPDNVFLERRDDGREAVRVLDFGIARLLDQTGAGGEASDVKKALTRVGTIIGTPGYMAPEQALGEVVDERADLYSLGVVLWELLAGTTLFPETDVTAIVTRQLTTEAPPLEIAGLPEEVRSLVAQLLQRDRSARVERAADVRDLLKRFALESELERITTGPQVLQRATATGAFRNARATGSTPSQGVPLELVGLLAATMLALGAVILVGVIALVRTEPAPAVGPAPGPLAALPLEGPTDPRPVVPPDETVPAGVEPPVADSAGLGADFDTILHDASSDARLAAAERILASGPGGPEVARLVAEMEVAEGCRDKRAVLRRIRELGDARARPLLDRLDDLPRRGCGFMGTGDCWRCMRRDLRSTRSALE